MQISLNKSQHRILLSLKNGQPVINLSGSKYVILRQIASKMQIQQGNEMYTILWTDAPLTVREIKNQQLNVKINHLPEITQITRKNKMTNNLNSIRLHFPKDYNFYPQSWVLPSDYQRLLKRHQKGKVYIVKPENGCQGQGIFLTTSPFKLQKQRNLIVQEYLPNPMLLNGLKFDLRMYVFITCINPLRVYLYNDGIVRCATQEFKKVSEENLDNFFSHLTNYAINKQHKEFKVDEENINDGHKRLISAVFKNQDYKELIQKVSKIVIKTIISGLPAMQSAYAQCKQFDPNAYFQLLGFDILLNDKKEPLLLEVNQNPSLSTDTSLDRKLKGQLVKNIFQMITGGYKIGYQEKMQTRIRLKDRHQTAFKGNFGKIYPCESLQQTQHYDQYMAKSQQLYRDRFGTGTVKSIKKYRGIKLEEDPLPWNEQSHHYTQDKVEKVYGARMSKTSNHRKRLIVF